LTNSVDSLRAPRWSPDRQFISFVDVDGLHVMEPNSGWTYTVFPEPPSRGSDWSPDGSMICFSLYGQGLGIVQTDPATGWAGEPSLVWADGLIYWPSWSPDGSKIAFGASLQDPNIPEPGWKKTYLTILDLASGEALTLYDFPAGVPQWSPDGQFVAFSAQISETITKGRKTTTNTYGELFIANADLTAVAQVTDFKAYDTSRPTWSSDGATLAFVSMPEQGGEYSLYTMSLDTGETTLLWTGVTGLDWTP